MDGFSHGGSPVPGVGDGSGMVGGGSKLEWHATTLTVLLEAIVRTGVAAAAEAAVQDQEAEEVPVVV